MADAQLKLQVLTPEQAVLAEEVDEVVLPADEGEIGVRPGHDPLLTSLGIGEMVVDTGEDRRRYFVERGFAEIFAEQVRVLAEDCQGVDEIDVEQAREKIQEAHREIERIESEAPDDKEEMLERYRESLEKQRQRLVASGDEDED